MKIFYYSFYFFNHFTRRLNFVFYSTIFSTFFRFPYYVFDIFVINTYFNAFLFRFFSSFSKFNFNFYFSSFFIFPLTCYVLRSRYYRFTTDFFNFSNYYSVFNSSFMAVTLLHFNFSESFSTSVEPVYFKKALTYDFSLYILFMFPVGALTSKPYAFVSRPWEISSSEGIDFFDSFLSTVRMDERGLKVIRILPVSNSSNNEIWISDRIRFCYSFQNNQTLLSNVIFYDNLSFFVSSEQISILFFLAFSKTNSIIYDFGTPTPLEFQFLCFNFSNFYNKGFTTFDSSPFYPQSDFRSGFIDPHLKKPSSYTSTSGGAFFVVNFNTRYSFPIFNSFFRLNVSSFSTLPVFCFGSTFFSNFTSYSTIGTNPISFFNFLTFKSKLNKLFFERISYFKFIFPEKSFSNFNPLFFSNFYNNSFSFSNFDFNSSSIISSELNFSSFKFKSDNSFSTDSDFSFLSYNSSQEASFFSKFSPKFTLSFESNFSFHESKPLYSPDFLISFPNIFSFVSTFLSVDGALKISNNLKKLPHVSTCIFKFFYNFFPFLASQDAFTNFFFKTPYAIKGDTPFPLFSFDFFLPQKFSFSHSLSSDSIFSSESARSHYLRSPCSRFSTALVLHYSRSKNITFNHSYLKK